MAERFSRDEVLELKKKCDYLTKQLEYKELYISELRAYQQMLLTKLQLHSPTAKESVFERLAQLEVQFQEKEAQFQKLLLEKTQLAHENRALQFEVERLQQNVPDPHVPKFVSSVLDLVKKCHPENHFPGGKPELKECWRWLKRILHDYIIMKQ